MKRVRFHRSIYFPTAVAEGVAVFAEFGRMQIEDKGSDYIEVEIETPDASDERALVGAFANYVLGASVHAHQQQAG